MTIICSIVSIVTSPIEDDGEGGDTVSEDIVSEVYSFRELVDAFRELTPSCSQMWLHTWFHEFTPDINFETGEETEMSLHYDRNANNARAWKYWIKAARHVFGEEFVGDLT